MHSDQALASSAKDTCIGQPRPSLDLFYQRIQQQMEQQRAAVEARSPHKGALLKSGVGPLKLLSGLIHLQARRTACYHFPSPTVAHVNHLVRTAPGNPERLQWPSSPVWLQFDEPICPGSQEDAIAALHFTQVFDPAIPDLLREVYKGQPHKLEQNAQASFAKGLGHWHLEFVTLTAEGGSELLSDAILCYDATLSLWSYPIDRHTCTACIEMPSEDAEPLILECADCQVKRKARSTWFATALALLQRNPQPAAELHLSDELFTAPTHHLSQPYAPGQKRLTTVTLSSCPPEAHTGVENRPQDDAALLPPPFTGVYHHPTTGRYQVWMSADLNTLQWVAVHRHQVSAERLSAIIDQRSEELRSPSTLRDLLRLLTCDSEGSPVRASAQAEQAILERCRIAAQQPRFEPSLGYFSQFLLAIQQMGKQHEPSTFPIPYPTSQAWLEKIQGTHFARCAEGMSIVFADASALKLCAAMLSADGHAPEFPGQPLWIQPMARLWFRGKLVRGVCITPVSLRPLFDHEAPKSKLSAEEKEQAWQQIASLEGSWHVHVGVDANYTEEGVPSPDVRTSDLYCFSFACYTANGQWKLTARATETCPTGRCLCEVLGTQPTVIPCQDCQAELEYWARWLKTWFWVMCGKFRKASDTSPFETAMMTLPVESGSTRARGQAASDKPRTYQVTTISFDASYFLPAANPPRKRSALKDQYLVLTAEEALAEGAMEVDLDGVLIRDFGAVRGYYRRRPGQQEKQYIEPKDRRAQYISLRRWKARQRGAERHVTDVLASGNGGRGD